MWVSYLSRRSLVKLWLMKDNNRTVPMVARGPNKGCRYINCSKYYETFDWNQNTMSQFFYKSETKNDIVLETMSVNSIYPHKFYFSIIIYSV